jgi:hypothetical protein
MRRARASWLLVVLLASGPAWAAPAGEHPEGEYGGVTPGEAPPSHPDEHPGGKARKPRPPPRHTLTWIGFEAKDGDAHLFFQAAEPFTAVQYVDHDTLVVVLEGLRHMRHNTRRPLDTRFFDQPVARVVARPVGARRAGKAGPGHKAGVMIRIWFKDPKAVREGAIRTATEADKLFYTYLDIQGAGGAGDDGGGAGSGSGSGAQGE